MRVLHLNVVELFYIAFDFWIFLFFLPILWKIVQADILTFSNSI